MPSLDMMNVASSYLQQKQQNGGLRMPSTDSLYKQDRGFGLNILFLGLSFMGQPFQSLACKYSHLLSGGEVLWPEKISVEAIRKNDGQCTGFKLQEIRDFFPASIHPKDYPIPKQNSNQCQIEHSILEFSKNKGMAPSVESPVVRGCYVYSFNLEKNLKKGDKLPCGWDW